MAKRATEAREDRRLSHFLEAPAPGQAPAPAPPAPRPTLTVAQVVNAAKGAIEATPALADAWVRGEVSKITFANSGHWYFDLKDAEAVLRCTMWRFAAARVRFEPQPGMQLLVRGSLGVYVPRGDLSFNVTEMQPDGAGALAVALEQLKRKLAAEGLFDPARKKPLPLVPRVVGVVTSRTGAVWHDIQNVARRRFPGVTLVLRSVRVQGEGAADEIAAAIRLFNEARAADVLIVGRGGGSAEDLWAFNEERVVRAICGSAIPVVSAVGHETDYTLADLAADVRAATPSQAAEIVVPEADALRGGLAEGEMRLRVALRRRADLARARLDRAAASTALTRPERWLAERRQRLDEGALRLASSSRRVLDARGAALAERAAKLDALSPLGTLARGYAVARRRDGRVVRSVRDVEAGDDVDVIVRDGTVRASVRSKEESSR